MTGEAKLSLIRQCTRLFRCHMIHWILPSRKQSMGVHMLTPGSKPILLFRPEQGCVLLPDSWKYRSSINLATHEVRPITRCSFFRVYRVPAVISCHPLYCIRGFEPGRDCGYGCQSPQKLISALESRYLCCWIPEISLDSLSTYLYKSSCSLHTFISLCFVS